MVPGLTASPISPPGLKPCPMVLVFGCRQSKIDHIYKEETLFAKTQGVFRELYTAYSREPDKPKVRGGHCSGPGAQPRAAVASRHSVEVLVPWHSHGSSCPGVIWVHKCAGSCPSQHSPVPRARPHPCTSLNACPHHSRFTPGSCSHPHQVGADEEGKGTSSQAGGQGGMSPGGVAQSQRKRLVQIPTAAWAGLAMRYKVKV